MDWHQQHGDGPKNVIIRRRNRVTNKRAERWKNPYMWRGERVWCCRSPVCSLPALWLGIFQQICKCVWFPPPSSSSWNTTPRCHRQSPAGCWFAESLPETQHQSLNHAQWAFEWDRTQIKKIRNFTDLKIDPCGTPSINIRITTLGMM